MQPCHLLLLWETAKTPGFLVVCSDLQTTKYVSNSKTAKWGPYLWNDLWKMGV